MYESEKLNSNSGIYRIYCFITDKQYIGSSVDIKKRWRYHKSLLKNNKHHSKRLQNAWNKYGKENFVFEIVCLVSDFDEMRVLETRLIKETKSYDQKYGYNMSLDSFSPMLGKKHTEKVKNKLSQKNSKENHWAWGKKQKEEHNRKTSIKNKKYSDEQEREMFYLYESGLSYKEIQILFCEKHLETIRRAIKRVDRFREYYGFTREK